MARKLQTAGLILIVTIFAGVAHANAKIRITIFNIANLGDTAEVIRSLVSIANAIRETNPDIVAIQEIEPGEIGERQVSSLVQLLNKAASFYNTEHYSSLITEFETGDERYAFPWRPPVKFDGEVSLLPPACPVAGNPYPPPSTVPQPWAVM